MRGHGPRAIVVITAAAMLGACAHLGSAKLDANEAGPGVSTPSPLSHFGTPVTVAKPPDADVMINGSMINVTHNAVGGR
jgi:hypothetical protein